MQGHSICLTIHNLLYRCLGCWLSYVAFAERHPHDLELDAMGNYQSECNDGILRHFNPFPAGIKSKQFFHFFQRLSLLKFLCPNTLRYIKWWQTALFWIAIWSSPCIWEQKAISTILSTDLLFSMEAAFKWVKSKALYCSVAFGITSKMFIIYCKNKQTTNLLLLACFSSICKIYWALSQLSLRHTCSVMNITLLLVAFHVTWTYS